MTNLKANILTGFILTITAVTLSFASAAAQRVQQRTPLLIGITVEGLTDESLTLLEPQLSPGGFKRLMDNGVTLTNVKFGPGIDPTASAAMVHTGASPSVSGVPAAKIFDQEKKVTQPIFYDRKFMGNFTNENYSGKAMKVTTIADEIRIDTDGDGLVYTIASDPQTAIAIAGHTANGVYWIEDQSGNWATTTYFGEMPKAVSERNYRNSLTSRIGSIIWTPMLEMTEYPLLSKAEIGKPFKVTFQNRDDDRFRKFKATPAANTEITDVAIDLINSLRLGSDRQTDVLNISYNLAFPGATRTQIMDAYLRLDADLQRLFMAADRVAGIGNVTIMVCGLPTVGTVSPDPDKWRTPSGEFSVKKAEYLLELYLIAVHGNADWVTGYHNRQIFLNRKLITDRDLNLKDFRAEVADFMARMEGVSGVYTVDDVIASRAGEDPQATKRNTDVTTCGDVFIEVAPGWQIVDDPMVAVSDRPGAQRFSAVRIPAIIAGPGIDRKQIDQPVDVRSLAPALTSALRFRSPSGASSNELRLR